jgi:DNA-binding XRE family transcriptional regulator
VAAKLDAHIAQVETSLRHSTSPDIRQGLALVLADAAALSGWQAIDMGNLTAAWHARRMAGLSRAELARRAATSRPTLAAYAAGTKNPTFATAERIARAAGFDLATLGR